MKTTLLFLLSTLLFVGCYHEGNIEYLADLRKVPKNFINHFPKKIADSMSVNLIMNKDTSSGCIYYMLFEYEKNDIKKPFLDSINNRSISKFQSSDTNIISVKRETVTYWHPEKNRTYKNLVFGDKFYYPVPYFEKHSSLEYRGNVNDIYSDTTTSGLSQDFMIYVFDYKPGIYWKGLRPLNYMPTECKNGYSKGIALNEKKKIIIYWFIIW